jgi:hypothetical protein
MRELLALVLVTAGFAAIPAGVWVSAGAGAGLIATGISALVFGLVFVDVDSRKAGRNGESAQ